MSTYESFLDDPLSAFTEAKADVYVEHLEECRRVLGPVSSVPDSVRALADAAKTLAAFVRKDNSLLRLPADVEAACREIENLP